jgi:hypothetical protein
MYSLEEQQEGDSLGVGQPLRAFLQQLRQSQRATLHPWKKNARCDDNLRIIISDRLSCWL